MERERAAHAFNGQLESRQCRYRVTPEMVRWNQHFRASEGARVKCFKVCVDYQQEIPLQSRQESEVDSRSPADQIR